MPYYSILCFVFALYVLHDILPQDKDIFFNVSGQEEFLSQEIV